MIKFLTTVFISCAVLTSGLSSAFAEPFNDVVDLLESGGGTRLGQNEEYGTYLVSLEFSDKRNQEKAKAQAKLLAQKSLSEFINGSNVSGSASASIRVSSTADGSEHLDSHFYDTVQSSFSGKVSAARVIKQGEYKGKHFLALLLAETEVNKSHQLKTIREPQPELAGTGQKTSTVEVKGIAPLKAQKYKQVRETAIQDALRSAIEQANGVNIAGKSGQFGEAITIAFSAKSNGYVRTYDITSEYEKRGNVIVEIKAEIDEGKLVSDARLYLDAFSNASFALVSNDQETISWLTNQLESLGFTLQEDASTATHLFEVDFAQVETENNRGNVGIQSQFTIKLKEVQSSEIVFTLINDYRKSAIYVSPITRSKQVSKNAALKSIKSKLNKEVIQALAKKAERGSVYKIIITDANRVDMNIFQHIFNTSTSGKVESWQWQRDDRELVLNFRTSSSLSEAMNEAMANLYSTYKAEASHRRPVSTSVSLTEAHFVIVRK